MMRNRREFWETHMALSRIAAVSVFIGHRLKEAEIQHIVGDSRAAFLIFEDEWAPRIRAAYKELSTVLPDGFISVPGSDDSEFQSFDRLVAHAPDTAPQGGRSQSEGLIYTSGTTGKPKGAVRRLHRGTMKMLFHIIREFRLRPHDVHLVTSPLYHSAPLGFSLVTQILGGTLCLMRKFEPEEALRLIEKERITTTTVVPTMLDAIAALPRPVLNKYDLSSLRAVICGGAPLHPKTKLAAMQIFGEILYEYYGSTETGINLLMKPREMRRKVRSCGRPFPSNQVKILDSSGREVGPGQPGELYVSSPGLIHRYHNSAPGTGRQMRGKFLSVGDIAVCDEEGFYYIVDRAVDMVISGGVNIYPTEVERVIHAHPKVFDVAVIGIPDPHWGESLKALVVLRPEATATPEEIIQWCSEKLADYKKPKSVEFLQSISRSAQGKIVKSLLKRRYAPAYGDAGELSPSPDASFDHVRI